MELKDEITAIVTNHTNKLIDNLEMKYQQMNRNIEKNDKTKPSKGHSID